MCRSQDVGSQRSPWVTGLLPRTLKCAGQQPGGETQGKVGAEGPLSLWTLGPAAMARWAGLF